MKKRILHVIPSLDRAGAEKQLSLLAPRLAADELDVHVCALTRGGPLEADLRRAGIPVTLIGKRWRIDPQAYWRLRRHVARLRPELIQTALGPPDRRAEGPCNAAGTKGSVPWDRCCDARVRPMLWRLPWAAASPAAWP